MSGIPEIVSERAHLVDRIVIDVVQDDVLVRLEVLVVGVVSTKPVDLLPSR